MTRSSSVAAALAVLPGKEDSPRVIKQFTSIFLVGRKGELWRVYDTDTSGAANRQMPSPNSRLPHRLFVAVAAKEEVRVHTFVEGASRETDPASLQEQLDQAV